MKKQIVMCILMYNFSNFSMTRDKTIKYMSLREIKNIKTTDALQEQALKKGLEKLERDTEAVNTLFRDFDTLHIDNTSIININSINRSLQSENNSEEVYNSCSMCKRSNVLWTCLAVGTTFIGTASIFGAIFLMGKYLSL